MTHPPEPKQPEGLALNKIVLVGIVSLAIGAAGVFWAERILGRRDSGWQPVHRAGQAEVGIVNQLLFAEDLRAERLRAQNMERLSSYGWVDRSRSRIHVPVEHAMAAVAAEHAKEPSR